MHLKSIKSINGNHALEPQTAESRSHHTTPPNGMPVEVAASPTLRTQSELFSTEAFVLSNSQSVASPASLNPTQLHQLHRKLKAIQEALLKSPSFEHWFDQARTICSDFTFPNPAEDYAFTKLEDEHILGLMKCSLGYCTDTERMSHLTVFESDELCELYNVAVPPFVPSTRSDDGAFMSLDNELLELAILTFGSSFELLSILKNSGLQAALGAIRQKLPAFKLDAILRENAHDSLPHIIEQTVIFSFLANHELQSEGFSPFCDYFENLTASDFGKIRSYGASAQFLATHSLTAKRFSMLNENLNNAIAHCVLMSPAFITSLRSTQSTDRFKVINDQLNLLSTYGFVFTEDPDPENASPLPFRIIHGTLFFIFVLLSDSDRHELLKTFSLIDLFNFRNVVLPFPLPPWMTESKSNPVRTTKSLIIQHMIHRILGPQKIMLGKVQNIDAQMKSLEPVLSHLLSLDLVNKSDAAHIRETGNYYGLLKLVIVISRRSKWKIIFDSWPLDQKCALYRAKAPRIKRWKKLEAHVSYFDSKLHDRALSGLSRKETLSSLLEFDL